MRAPSPSGGEIHLLPGEDEVPSVSLSATKREWLDAYPGVRIGRNPAWLLYESFTSDGTLGVLA